MTWHIVYSLEADVEEIASVQKASLETEFGLVPEPALFGSSEWWDAVHQGVLATHVVEGTITQIHLGEHE